MRSKKGRAICFVMAGFILWTVAYACAIEPSRLVVRRQTITTAALPPLRIALISDLHAGARFVDLEKIRRVVNLTNAEHPDLVLLLGDYLNNGRHQGEHSALKGGSLEPEPVAEELGRLRASHGVYAILGNHDWWFDGERITQALEQQGITVLENRSVAVQLENENLWLAGLADSTTRRPDIAATLADVPDGAAVLALTHNPDIFPEVPAQIALTVAGHTHGGQVALPWMGRPIVPSRFDQRFAAGLVEERGHLLFVTSGVGTSILPVRFCVPPEIAILTIEPSAQHTPQALANSPAPNQERSVTTLQTHSLEGPFPSLERLFGCKPFECFEPWLGTVHAVRPTRAGKGSGTQYVALQRPAGWYVDRQPVDQYLCARDVGVASLKAKPDHVVVQFFECDVDPPDGTFLGQLAGIVICDLESGAPLCSDYTRLTDWDAGYADDGYAKLAPVKNAGGDVVVAGHRFRLQPPTK